MDRKFLIAANWKMHPAPAGFDAPDSPYRATSAVDVVVFPACTDLDRCIGTKLIVGAQTGRPEPSGAFTGDVSISQVKMMGCRYVLCGHSERRKNHGETDAFVLQQAIATLEEGLHPIVCIGETEDERKKGKEKAVIEHQLARILPLLDSPFDPTHLDAEHSMPRQGRQHETRNPQLLIAYEPVWAISGGDPTKPAATAKDAQETHAFIRSLLPKDQRDSTRILYGGSMNGKNCEELLRCPDIDGGLVGGASLKIDEFRKIVEVAENIK